MNSNKPEIEFVSYTGKYPNLCRGVLTVKINGKEYKFGHNYSNHHYNETKDAFEFTDEDPSNPNYESFWLSGGGCSWRDGCIFYGSWELDELELPEKFKCIGQELIDVFNENVLEGCCGGCL